MKRIAQEIANQIKDRVGSQIGNLQGAKPEFRTIFHGPPHDLMLEVLQVFLEDSGLEAILPNGNTMVLPVLFQVDQLPSGLSSPGVGISGQCDQGHLHSVRNSQNPNFVALLSPGGGQVSLSISTTSDEFGLAASNNSAITTIEEWWNDSFVQKLVNGALDRHFWPSDEQKNDAHRLIEKATKAADEANRHSVDRRGAWAVLSRIWSISDSTIPFGKSLSMACGFPPMEDGSIDAHEQMEVLDNLAGDMEDRGFKAGFEHIRTHAEPDDLLPLNEVLSHLILKCDRLTAFPRAPQYFYAPFQDDEIETAPQWWSYLTVEVWKRLLEETVDRPRGAIQIECVNSIIPVSRGIHAVVVSDIQLEVKLPEASTIATDVSIVREGAGAANKLTWTLTVPSNNLLYDNTVPPHKSPFRYSAEAIDHKKGSIRVISLNTWKPGVVIFSRTASKITFPKISRDRRANVSFETSLILNGQGRHYLDVFVGSGVEVSSTARGGEESDGVVEDKISTISKVSETAYGFEVDATSNCYYDIEIQRGDESKATLRIYLTCEEATPDHCGSEFERLILINRQSGVGRATTDVHVNRHFRCTDLESWMLDKNQVARSFYPLVLASDYSTEWRPRDWSSQEDTVLSKGVFLHDPRPQPTAFQPPSQFIASRLELCERIRGVDGNGLVETAKLGEWLASDSVFAETVETYVRSYLEWLEAEPNIAAWADIAILNEFESDGATLVHEPYAILVSPLHPIRLAWHCLAQRTLFHTARKLPCPAASIFDPDTIPDSIFLPLNTAAGDLNRRVFFSVECSSDYWGVLWNAERLDRLSKLTEKAPFDRELGILVGGISSGFSLSQVYRALDDVSSMLVAKPVLNILVTSAAGRNNACNEGLVSWCRKVFGVLDEPIKQFKSLGPKFIQILDGRDDSARPDDAEIANLAEDTGNSVRWYGSEDAGISPDLGIIAQLETSGPGYSNIKIGSPLGFGGLIRYRVRQQLKAGAGAFLSETRTGSSAPPSGDGLADKTIAAIVRLENLGPSRVGYIFAPSVNAIRKVLKEAKAGYAAVSSSALDPACFLGDWLEGAYLWDYDLPSYSSRAGDSNGYYLLSGIKDSDRETLKSVLCRLPGCGDIANTYLDEAILEVARRGIPTVRGLSSGHSGASGDLGLFVAARILQDEFRVNQLSAQSLLPAFIEREMDSQIVLVIPIDPFTGYLNDLTRAIGKESNQRPDLIVVGIHISDSRVAMKLTPVEVKYRSAKEPMPIAACQDALNQAKSLSELFEVIRSRSIEPEMLLWKLAFQHLLTSMIGFGFRVYSQQSTIASQRSKWSSLHARAMEAILSDEMELEIDAHGRLIVIDGSNSSGPRDSDGDGFKETIVLSHGDAASVVKDESPSIYAAIKAGLGDWGVLPKEKEVIGALKYSQTGEQPAISNECPTNESENHQAGDEEESDTVVIEDEPNNKGQGVDSHPTTHILRPVQENIGDIRSSSAKCDGVEVLVGETVDGFRPETRRINLSDTRLNQLNIGVVGDLGTGKTQLLKSLVYQIARGSDDNQGVPPRVLIFDYKKDYSSDDFVKAVGAKVIKPHHLPLNLFDVAGAGNSMTPWLNRFNFFADVLDKIYTGIGPVQRQQLKRAVREAYENCKLSGRQPTIYDVHSNYQAILGNRFDAPLSIIDDLVDMEIFAREPTAGDGFDKFLDGVVIISLDALGQDDKSKNMLVAIMLNMFYEHMLRIPKRPYIGSNPQLRVIDSFLLVDEADNIMRYEFDVLRKILLQGREFGVGVILASQYLKHFKAGATDYREPLLTWFIHKVPNITPQELGALGMSGETSPLADRIKSLSVHECLFKTFDVSGEIVKGKPFYKLLSPPEIP